MKPEHATGALILAGALTGCGAASGAERIEGGQHAMFGGMLSAWATQEESGIREVGVTVPFATISDAFERSSGKEVSSVAFPPEVAETTYFHHLTTIFIKDGLTTIPVYSEPLFAFHFFGVSDAEKHLITCLDEPEQPPPDRVPPGYSVLGPGLFPSDGGCIVEDGVHAVDTTAPEQQTPPGPYTVQTFLGYHDGDLVHIEPMISRGFLMQRESFAFPVRRPAALGRSTQYPGMFEARWDADADAYHFVWSSFSEIH